ncbi:MAG: GTPase HflX [Eggerthellaceae bacterium]|jgi:GTP-binding protein HflX
MAKNDMYVPAQDKERALLVGVDRPHSPWPLESSLAELGRLAETAGAEVVGTTTQRLEKINPRTFVGQGKAEEIAQLCLALAVDVVMLDDELTPSQQANLEKIVPRDVKVIDRTALILDIFALHATSKEGRLQVRLAQNEYLYPRLRGMWAHLASNRMGGGVGSRFGEGESQLEVDRRIVRNRITQIKRQLKDLERTRSLQRKDRYESGIFKVALAGYTNAGKSSLMNALTGAGVLSYDQLFATLDSKSKRLVLPEGREVTLTDTVGFIQKLPTNLIEAFKSTLDEIRGANLILHVIDASQPEFSDQMKTVDSVLLQIGAGDIERVEVFNKIDRLDPAELEAMRMRKPEALFVSAVTGEGLDTLKEHISKAAANTGVIMDVLIPYSRGDLVSLAHERCHIIAEDNTAEGTSMRVQASAPLQGTFQAFQQRA